MVPVQCFFVLSAILFFIGVFGFVTRRNLIAMLISVELILNAVDINFAAFNRLLFPGEMEGFFFTLFSIGVSAAESAVANSSAMSQEQASKYQYHQQSLVPKHTSY